MLLTLNIDKSVIYEPRKPSINSDLSVITLLMLCQPHHNTIIQLQMGSHTTHRRKCYFMQSWHFTEKVVTCG